MINLKFWTWKRKKSRPTYVQILKFFEKGCDLDSEELKEKKGEEWLNLVGEMVDEGFIIKITTDQIKDKEDGGGVLWAIFKFKIAPKGKFKLYDIQQLEFAWSAQHWTEVAVYIALFTALVSSWFAWKDDNSDEEWIKQQAALSQQQIELLQEISEKLDQ